MLSEKNQEALSVGSVDMLFKFANLPVGRDADTKPLEQFRERFGDLFPGSDVRDYRPHVSAFRRAWKATKEHDLSAVGDYIRNVLNRSTDWIEGDYIKNVINGVDASISHEIFIEPPFRAWRAKLGGLPRPALTVDFSTGKIDAKPETLLDHLVSWLLKHYDKLAYCKKQDCEHPRYVKTHPRQQFCSPLCAKVGRSAYKKNWWAKHGERHRRKWRKQRKAARRAHQPKQPRNTRRSRRSAARGG